ncbi:hypothetical protein [Blastopirellula marina]|uniref:hypothetical protein n=1 Tax=Blastopirellula marina TaxID=124 RepID=UPI000322787C|nr:hypothetical protein [Blastopirellula marina]
MSEQSATVEMYLDVQGQRLGVAQAGADFLILREPSEVPEDSEGILGVIVDGELFERNVFFFEGISKAKRRVSFF